MPVRHTVRQGDSVIRLADEHGFFPGTIWSHPDNAPLRELRADRNVLLPGDIVTIPDKRPKTEQATTGKRHRFRRKGVPALYRLQVFDEQKPFANAKFRLVVEPGGGGGGAIHEGTTDARGVLSVPVPAGAERAVLSIGEPPHRFVVRFGHLDPVAAPTGLRERLRRAGFECGGETAMTLGDDTREALRRFQRRFGLPVTGEADGPTQAKLDAFFATVNDYPPEPAPT